MGDARTRELGYDWGMFEGVEQERKEAIGVSLRVEEEDRSEGFKVT